MTSYFDDFEDRQYNTSNNKQYQLKKRRKLNNNERFALSFRQQHKCNHCKKELEPLLFDFDHIVPLCIGGRDELDNIQILCVSCHRLKTYDDMVQYKKMLQYNRNNQQIHKVELTPLKKFGPLGDSNGKSKYFY